jgi:hypothetical protein
MRIAKRAMNVVLDVLVALVILVWAYLLYKDFSSLPSHNESAQYTLFNIKVLLFALFLIASIVITAFINLFSARAIEPSKVMKPVENSSEIKPLVSVNTEQIRRDCEEHLLQGISKMFLIRPFSSEMIETFTGLTASKRISIFMYDPEDKNLQLVNHTGFQLEHGGKVSVNMDSKDSLLWHVFKSGKRMYATNVETHPEIARKNGSQYKKKSIMLFPIKIMQEEIVGVVNFSEKDTEEGVFSKTDLDAAGLLVSMFEMRLENKVCWDSLQEVLGRSADK